MSLTKAEIDGLLSVPSENLNVELKAWIDLTSNEGKSKIIKAIFALRNRNGGYLLIGIDNNTLRPPADGSLPPLDYNDFNTDFLCSLVTKYASMAFQIFVGFGMVDGKKCCVIKVPEGVRSPVVVRADLRDPEDVNRYLLREGEVYFRTLNANGMPSSARAHHQDWQEIVDICFENREADFGRFLRRHLGREGILGLTEALASAEPQAVGPKPLEERCIETLQQGEQRLKIQTEKRTLTDEEKQVLGRGSWSVALVVEPARPNALPTKDFYNTVASANPSLTGWPVWLDSRGFRGNDGTPVVANDAWEALIIGKVWAQKIDHFDFYRFDPVGKFYLFRILQDDLTTKVEPGAALDVILVLLRVAESIAVGLSIASKLGCDENTKLGFAFKWKGIDGRELSSWANSGVYLTSRKAHDDTVTSFVEVPIATPLSAISPYVSDAIRKLFVLFDGFELSQSIVEHWTQRLLERRL